MVSAGLNGPARASVGAVRDFVLGAQVINGRGELLIFGGQVMKNVAGYDVSRLMAGAMGTLGVLAEVSIKVLPVAPAEATLCFEMEQADALAALNRWGGQPLPLNASCWVHDQGRSLLYVRLRGAVAAVEAACRSMGGQLLDSATVAPDWIACRDQTLPFSGPPGPLLRLDRPVRSLVATHCGGFRCHRPRPCWRWPACLPMPSWWSGTVACAGCGHRPARARPSGLPHRLRAGMPRCSGPPLKPTAHSRGCSPR